MRTNIVIDEKLIAQAMAASGTTTKRAAVEAGLRMLIQTKRQAGLRRLRGTGRWQGDVHASRAARTLASETSSGRR